MLTDDELKAIEYRHQLSTGPRDRHVGQDERGFCYGAMNEPGCPVCDADNAAVEDRENLLQHIREQAAELERVRGCYSLLYQGVWCCPPEEVSFTDQSAEETRTEAIRQAMDDARHRPRRTIH